MNLDQPIFPAPPGYSVDLANPQRSGVVANLCVGIAGMCIAALFVGTRLYTKITIARKLTSDDVALVFAWLFSIALQSGILYQYCHGTLGVHIWELTGNQVNFSLNLVNITSILYCPFLALAKFSLLFVYLKLSALRWWRICIFASMFLVVSYNIALMIPLIFACKPFMKTWDVSILEGNCIDRTPVFMATAVMNMVTDILLLVLPIPMVIELQMPRVQKAGLICAFGVGSATCVTSCVRLILLFPMLKTIDQTWAVVMPGLWILIEANLVIITGCLPTMRLFLRHIAPRVFGETSMRNRTRTRKQGTGEDNNSVQVSELQTIGSKDTKNLYSRMEDDQASLDSEEIATAGWSADQRSDRGIVVERGQIIRSDTVVVRSDMLDDAEKGNSSWKTTF